MKCAALRNLNEMYEHFIADGKNFNYEDTEQALEEFQNFLINLDVRLKASTVQAIYEEALLLGSVLEQQGFFHGMTKGVNLCDELERAGKGK